VTTTRLEETLFENWNRYYDPFTGRYLQPEPYLQNPKMVLAMGRSGQSRPTYSYAANNPIHHSDPDGKIPYTPLCLVFATVAILGSEYSRGPHHNDKMLHCISSAYISSYCGAGTGTLLGGLKEGYDKTGRGFAEWEDIKANAAGERCASPGVCSNIEDCCKRQLAAAGL
jgi:RHS repeat-associated protein